MTGQTPPVCLTIAGLDPSGGAGIIADVKTFTRFGCFAAAAITSLTFQNTTGVFGAIQQTAESIRGQVEPVLKDYCIAAVKTGMLSSRELILEVARMIKEFGLTDVVVDPVVRSTSGFDLIEEAALRSLIDTMFPLSHLVTPNLPEAERITGFQIRSEKDFEKAARAMQSMGAKNVLIKGGHLPISDSGLWIVDFANTDKNRDALSKKARDFLFTGSTFQIFEAEFIETTSTHGTGCTLSAAITANLALGKTLPDSIAIAKQFVTEAIRTSPGLGKGSSPIDI
jgi:hydroxymethylpyrimidine kinase/phosphomethylpyrimidine kinase